MDTASAYMPFELRLRTLEARIRGVPELSASPDAGPSRIPEGSRNVTRRVREVQEGLERLGEGSEALRRLIDGSLLSLHDASKPSSSSADGSAAETAIRPSDLLPDSTKLTMVLEAAPDIRSAERDLREIEVLRQRGVDGAGQLEELVPLRPVLVDAAGKVNARNREVERARGEVHALLRRYAEYRVEVMEEQVARAERKKRRELAERY